MVTGQYDADNPEATREQREAILLALIDLAEAALAYDGEYGHPWRCQYRTAAKGWKPGQPPIIECQCGLDNLERALTRFQKGTNE